MVLKLSFLPFYQLEGREQSEIDLYCKLTSGFVAGAIMSVLALTITGYSLIAIACQGRMETTCLEEARKSLAAGWPPS